MILYVANDNVLWARGLHVLSALTGLPVYLDASHAVQVTLLDSLGAEVEGQTWPAVFTYIAGSQGDFVAPLHAALEILPQAEITARVSVDAGANQYGEWRGRVLCQTREF